MTFLLLCVRRVLVFLSAVRWLETTLLPALLILSGMAAAQTISLSPASLTFGNQVINTTSKPKNVVMTNTGTAVLTISSIATTGNFAETNTCGSSLQPGAKCTISVTFTPTVTGLNSGSVIVTDNAPNSPQTVTTTGTGVQPVALTPASATFPARTVGSTSTPFAFTLKNNLATAITLSSISVTGDFAQTNTCGTSLAAGAKCTISVTFTPTQTGTRTGTLSVTDNASNSPQTGSVSGKGTTTGLVSIAVTPANPTISVGAKQQFTATGTFNTGSTYDLTKSVVWSSTATSVATISNSSGTQGLATAVANGSTTIKAASGSISGSTSLTVGTSLVSIAVTPAGTSIATGAKQQYTATGTYSDGSTQDLTSSATWASSAPNVATITSAGLATGVAVGTTTISATSGSVTGSTSLNVTGAPLVSLAVLPANVSIASGTVQQLKAVGTYTDGSTTDLTTAVTWSSSNVGVATISNTAGTQGRAQAVAPGTVTITATSGSITGSTSLTVTSATLTKLAVTPALASMPIGVPQQFNATGIFSDGTAQDLTQTVQWSSSATTIATVSNSTGTRGVVTSANAGSATISAASGSVTASTSLVVTSATLTSITVGPLNATIAAGTARQFTATGNFSDSSTRDLTTAVTWTSSNQTVATISNTGWGSGSSAGTTNLTATLNTVSGSTGLTVSGVTLTSIAVTPSTASAPIGTTQQFTATGTFSDSSTQDITGSVHWTSSNGTIATVSNTPGGQGMAAAIAAGSASIVAALGSVTGSATVTVTTATLSSLSVSPQNPSIPLGSTTQFTATGTYSDNSTHDVTALATWKSSIPAVAVVSSTSGTIISASAGTTAVTASYGGNSGSSNLTVNSGLVSVAVTPSSPTIQVGGKQQFTATATYSNGSTQDVTTSVTWTSSNTSVAGISNVSGSQGLATGLGAGSTTISAASGSVSGTATLTVTAPSLVSIAVTPSSASIMLGAKQQFTATGTYSDGSTQNLTTSVTWTSSNTAVATISNTSGSQGLATAVATGSSTITATSGSISGTASLTVTPATLVSIALTPSSASVSVGGTQQFAATGTYSDGSTQNLTTTATWSSSNTAVATISNASGTQGLATGVASGSVTISATFSGKTGMAALTVAGVANVWAQDPSPLGPPVRCFVTAPSGHILACVPGVGVFISTNGGSSWSKTAGTGLVDVEVDALLYSGSTLLAGTHDGVYASTNEGASWTKSSSGLPTIYKSTVTIFRFATFGSTIYAGTDNGVYISTNAGQSWTAAGSLPNIHVRGLAVDSAGVIYAGLNDGGDGGATTKNGSLWISRDGGSTWTWAGFNAWTTRSVYVNGQTIFAGVWRTPYTTGGIEESYDGGTTWTLVLANYSPNEIAMINGVLYVATRESQLFSSVDNGKTFQQITTGSGAQFTIFGAPAGLLLGSDGIYTSTDSGGSWSRQNLSSASQVAQLLYGSDGSIYAKSMLFGISKSTDNGATWSYINNGSPVYQQRGIHANWMIFNANGELLHEVDNSLYRYQNGLWTKANLNSNTYLNAIILLASGDILIGDAANCVYRSTDGGSNFGLCTHINTGTGGGVIFDLILDSSGNLYAAEDGTGAWESSDMGNTWTFIGAGPSLAMGNMYSLAFFNNTLYAAKAGGTNGVIFRYLGNSTWTRSDNGIASSTVYQLLATPSGKFLAFGDLSIDVSTDGQNWTPLVTGAPRFTNPYYDDVAPMQRPAIGPDGKVHVGISYGGYGSYSASVQ